MGSLFYKVQQVTGEVHKFNYKKSSVFSDYRSLMSIAAVYRCFLTQNGEIFHKGNTIAFRGEFRINPGDLLDGKVMAVVVKFFYYNEL